MFQGGAFRNRPTAESAPYQTRHLQPTHRSSSSSNFSRSIARLDCSCRRQSSLLGSLSRCPQRLPHPRPDSTSAAALSPTSLPNIPAHHSPNLAALADPNELFLPGERQNNLDMSSSPVPLLKPPVPGPRNNNNNTANNNPNGPRNNSPRQPPKLKLGIPPSPKNRPVQDDGTHIPELTYLPQRPVPRPAAPQLRLATPMGGQDVPQEGKPGPPPLIANGSTDSNGLLDGKASRPGSASSSTYSALSFAMGLRQPHGGTPDPSSGVNSVYSGRDGSVAMERDNSVNDLLPDLDKLSLEKGRPLDVEDLDDEGWLAASERKKIEEIGSLGEGAGGAVTRCKLKDGKTVFALKVSCPVYLLPAIS